MLFTTLRAPAVLAIRVAAPLCCTTSVVPSQVATPPCTWTLKPSLPILDFASLAWMAASVALSSCTDPWEGAGLVAAGGLASLANADAAMQAASMSWSTPL